MAKVLVVTNMYGALNIVPAGNKDYYTSRNTITRTKEYPRIDEMDEKAAQKFLEENNGIDPDFVKPEDANKAIKAKDDEINQLKEQLAKLQNAKNTQSRPVEDLVQAINTATTAENVDEIAGNDKRSTVIAAATARKEWLKENSK